MKKVELQPCPKCGGDARIRHRDVFYRVECKTCRASTHSKRITREKTEKEAIKEAAADWNQGKLLRLIDFLDP